MTKSPSIFECQVCGYTSTKWLGHCLDCGSWNSFVEEKRAKPKELSPFSSKRAKATRLGEVTADAVARVSTSNAEFNRVLGGGIVPGSLVLIGGEPEGQEGPVFDYLRRRDYGFPPHQFG